MRTLRDVVRVVGRVKGSLTLFVLVTVLYLAFSSGEYFIGYERLYDLGFSWEQPLNVLSYWFAHVGIFHLVINLASLIFFALIVELALASVDVVAIFFSSAVLSALVFSLFNPGTMLLGASAGIGGLIASALALRLKKTVYAVIALVVLLEVLFLPLTSVLVFGVEEKIEKEAVVLETRLGEARTAGDVGKAKRISVELVEKEEELETLKTGKKAEQETPTDFYVHGLGAFFGVLYLWAFRREDLEKGLKWFEGVKERLRARKK